MTSHLLPMFHVHTHCPVVSALSLSLSVPSGTRSLESRDANATHMPPCSMMQIGTRADAHRLQQR